MDPLSAPPVAFGGLQDPLLIRPVIPGTNMLARIISGPIVLASVVALAGCSGDAADRGATADSADRRDSAAASGGGGAGGADSARRISSIPGFNTPESVKYDADLDVYFVSNI